MTKNASTFVNSFISLFSNIIEKGDKDVRTYCTINSKIQASILICLFIVWIYSSIIISKSFTGLLLNTFFKIKPIQLVNTLQDIRDNKNLKIMGTPGVLSKLSTTDSTFLILKRELVKLLHIMIKPMYLQVL